VATNVRLPAGFILDQQEDGSANVRLPQGFVLDQDGPSVADNVAGFARQVPAGFNQGLIDVAAAPVRIPANVAAWAAEKVGATGVAESLRKKWPTTQFLEDTFVNTTPEPTTAAERYGRATGTALGAAAIPSAGIMAAAPRMATAALPAAQMSTARAAVQPIAEGIAANPGTALAYDAAGAVTSGLSSQGAAESGFGPLGQTLAGIAGGFVPVVPALATAGTRRAIQRAYANQGEAGAYGSFVDDLGRPVTQFADEVAAGGSRSNVTTNRRTLDILGEEMVRANGDRQAAQAATISRISSENGITPQAAAQHLRRLTAVHEDSPLMLAEYPAVSQSDMAQRMRQAGNVDLDEIGRVQPTAVQSTLDYLANNGNAQSAQTVRQAIARRQEELSPNVQGALADMGPQTQTGQRTSRPTMIDDVANQIAAADQIARQEYRAAYQGPINNRYSVHFLPQILQANMNRAAGRAGEPRAAIERAISQFYITRPNGQRLPMMTLQQLQDARASVRGQISEYRRAGRDDLVNAVQPIYRQITTLMERMSPQWGVANRRWADGRFDELAGELGDAFSLKAGPRFREQLAEFQALAPEAQDIVRVHFLQKLYDKFDNLPDNASVARMFANDQSRRMIGDILGHQAAVDFTRIIRNTKVAESSQAMMGNSATHRRGVTQKQKDAETGIVTAISQGSVQNARNWLMERAAQLMTEHRNRPLADIMTTPLNDTARVAEHLHRMIQQESRLQALASPDTTVRGPYGATIGEMMKSDDGRARMANELHKMITGAR
jgi:hypothetical protein